MCSVNSTLWSDPCQSIISHFPETPSPECQLSLLLLSSFVPTLPHLPTCSHSAKNIFCLFPKTWQFQSNTNHLHVSVQLSSPDFIFHLQLLTFVTQTAPKHLKCCLGPPVGDLTGLIQTQQEPQTTFLFRCVKHSKIHLKLI